MIRSTAKIFRNLARKFIQLQPEKEIADSDLEYLLWICNLYLQIKSIPGHIAEVGVAGGRNTVLFGRLIQIHGDSSVRQYIGFDTFNGYNKKDLQRDNHLAQNTEHWKAFSKKGVLERCIDNGIEKEIELFEGDAEFSVPKILAEHTGKKFQASKARFAIVYIDCNAYGVALKSMQAFLPHMVPGSIFAIDEKMQGGESEAMIEFAKVNKLNIEKPGMNQVPMLIRLPK
jgi:hypothetical protein